MVERIGPIGTPEIPQQPVQRGKTDGNFGGLLAHEIDRLQRADVERLQATAQRTSEILKDYERSLGAFEESIDRFIALAKSSDDVGAADLDPSLAHFRAMSGKLQDLRAAIRS